MATPYAKVWVLSGSGRTRRAGRRLATSRPPCACFEAVSHLGREPWRGVDIEAQVRGAEQRHRDTGGVDLAGHAAAEHGNAVDGQGEVLVTAPRQRAVLEPRR